VLLPEDIAIHNFDLDGIVLRSYTLGIPALQKNETHPQVTTSVNANGMQERDSVVVGTSY